MIKETSTCSYLMIIYTPRLCNDVAFLPPQQNFAQPISCQPVLRDSEVDDWEAAGRLEDKTRETERLIAAEDENPLRGMQEGAEGRTKRRPIIGGIEVGAQALVGSEGKVIEKSVVVGGGKETYLGTVATSKGFQMSKEEMKRLEIQDPKDVEKLKKNLGKLAGRKGWKLDLVDTPRGKEFRGIIEADEDEDDKAGKGSKSGSKSGGEKKKGMKKEDGGKEEKEEAQEGSEEVYKDEL
jgi:protein OS-9